MDFNLPEISEPNLTMWIFFHNYDEPGEKSLTKANIVAQFAHLAALFDLLLKQAEVRQQIGDEKT